MINIGVIAEGFRDIDVIEEVLSLVITEEFSCLLLQPDEISAKSNGNGWEGVWKWCLQYKQNYKEYLKIQSPRLDLLIIQLDGDTTREKKCSVQMIKLILRFFVQFLKKNVQFLLVKILLIVILMININFYIQRY